MKETQHLNRPFLSSHKPKKASAAKPDCCGSNFKGGVGGNGLWGFSETPHPPPLWICKLSLELHDNPTACMSPHASLCSDRLLPWRSLCPPFSCRCLLAGVEWISCCVDGKFSDTFFCFNTQIIQPPDH